MNPANADASYGAAAATTARSAELDGDVLAARWAIPGALIVWGLGSLAMAISKGIRDLAIGRADTGAKHLVVILAAGGLVCTALAVLLFLDLAPDRIARQRRRLTERHASRPAEPEPHGAGRAPQRHAGRARS